MGPMSELRRHKCMNNRESEKRAAPELYLSGRHSFDFAHIDSSQQSAIMGILVGGGIPWDTEEMEKLPLSVCFVVKDESERLAQAIESVAPFAAEIVVLDTGSTDNTAEVASSYTDNIFKYPFNFDFGALRNYAANRAKQDWILFLDADEILDFEAYHELKPLISETSELAFKVKIRTYTSDAAFFGWQRMSARLGNLPKSLESFTGFVEGESVRLYANFKGIQWSGLMNESVQPSLESRQRMAVESSVLIHHAYELRPSDQRKVRGKTFLQMMINQVKADPRKPSAWLDLGRWFMKFSNLADAEKALRQAVQLDSQLAEAKTQLGKLLVKMGRFTEAEVFLRAVLDSGGAVAAEAHAQMSTALLFQGRIGEAEKFAEASLKINPDSITAHMNSAIMHFERKEFAKSKEHLLAAISLNPGDPYLRDALRKAEEGLKET